MFQVIEQTKEEKMEMYMEYSKCELIVMLLENQSRLSKISQLLQLSEYGQPDPRITTISSTGSIGVTPEWLKSST